MPRDRGDLAADERFMRAALELADQADRLGEVPVGAVVVVDDVITTAATCDEVARVLKRAGAERVYAAAVARTGGL